MTEYAKLVVAVDSTQINKGGQALSNFERTAKRTEKSVGSLGSVVRSVAAPLAAFLSVRAVIRASDEYGQMASRIRNATESTEEYEMVQARLLETANGTYRALSEAQEVYLSTADTLRDLGYATSEVLDITDSFSYALVRDAARADQARTAMDAYSKALMKGKIDADGFASILAATPSIVNGISAATGRSTEEIRKLGATGKLSVEALNEGLRRSREENKALADAMETSVQDALVNLQTQFGVFVGKVNETSGASGVLVESIGELADILADPATVEAAQQLAAGVVTAFSVIAKGARDTVEAVRWLSEEFAVAIGGIGLHDIERLEAEASRLQETLNRLESRGETGYAIYGNVQQSFNKIRSQLDQAYALAEMADGLGRKQGDVAAPQIDSRKAIAESRALVSAVAADSKVADAATKKLAGTYQSMEKTLARQLALYGQTSEVAGLRFELEQGSLKGIVGQQADYLIGLAHELDAKRDLTEQEKLRIDILRESGQLRAANDAQFELEYAAKIAEYERQGNAEALQRLETLRRIREVQMNADQAPGMAEGVSQAPSVTGLDGAVGGASSEITRLNEEAEALAEWRATELEKQREFLEARAINAEQFAEREQSINEKAREGLAKIETAKNQAIINSSADFFGNMAVLSQSGNKELGAIGKAAAIAQATMQGFVAVGNALAVPPYPVGLALAASAAVVTAANVASIAGVGFSAGGYTGDGGKFEPMGVVHGGEYVLRKEVVSQPGMLSYLESLNSGKGYASGGFVGSTGSVSPLKSAQPSGESSEKPITVNLVEDTSKAGKVEQVRNDDGSQALNIWVSRIRAGGNAESQALEQAYGLTRAGR